MPWPGAATCAFSPRAARRLLSQIAAAGLLNDLCLTYSPVLEGGQAGRILTAPTRAAGLPPARAGLRLAHVLEDEGYLLCRYLLACGLMGTLG